MFAREQLAKALAHRARVRRARRAKRTLQRMQPPSHARYLGDLLAMLHELQRDIRDALAPIFAGLHQDSADDSPESKIRVALRKLKLKWEQPAGAHLVAVRMASETERANRAAMNAQFRELVGIDIFGENPALARTLQASIRRNVGLIASLPTAVLDDVEKTIAPAVAQGARVEELQRQLQDRFDVSKSRAAFIARDQVGKLNGELVQERQQSVGVDEYEWSTSNDERVRGTPGGPKSTGDHYHLNHTVQKWSEPPIVDPVEGRRAHPGEDFQCRCQALPRVNALLDALGVSEDELPLSAVPEDIAAQLAPAQPAPPPRRARVRRAPAAPALPPPPPAPPTPRAPVAFPTAVQRRADLYKVQPLSDKTAQRVFERQPNVRALLGADSLPDGYHMIVTDVSERTTNLWNPEDKNSVEITAVITTSDADMIGNVSRTYERTAEGKLEVKHSLLTLEDAHQGAGIGARVFNSQIEAYKKLGVDKVKLEAAWKGKYVWPRAGFEWTDAAQVKALKAKFRAHLAEKFGVKEARSIMRGVRSAYDLSQVRVGEERVGKEFLLNYEDEFSLDMSQRPDRIKPL